MLRPLLVNGFATCIVSIGSPLMASQFFDFRQKQELESFQPRNFGLTPFNSQIQQPEFDVDDRDRKTSFSAPAAVNRQQELIESQRTVGAKPGAYSSTPTIRRTSSNHRLGNKDAAITFGWWSYLIHSERTRTLEVTGRINAELFNRFDTSLVEATINANYNTRGTPEVNDDQFSLKGSGRLLNQTFEVIDQTYDKFQGRKDLPRRRFHQTFFERSTVVWLGYVPFTISGRLTGSVGYRDAYAEATIPNSSRGLVLYSQIVPDASLDTFGTVSPGIEQLNRFTRNMGVIGVRTDGGVKLNLINGAVRLSASADKNQTCLMADTEAITSLSGKIFARLEYSLPIAQTVVEIVDYLCSFDIFGICRSRAAANFRTIVVGYSRNKQEKSLYDWHGTTLRSGTSWGRSCESWSSPVAFASPVTSSGSGGSTGSPSPSPPNIRYEWEYYGDSVELGACYKYKDGLYNSRVENFFCGKARVQIEVGTATCSRYIDGSFDEILLPGEDECPARN